MSIEERQGAKGTYLRVRWSLPPDPRTGKRRRGEARFLIPKDATPTQAKRIRQAAAKKDLEMRGAAGLDAADAGDRTVGEYLDEWLASRTGEIEPSSAIRYRRVVDNQLRPALGPIRLDRLTAADCEAALAAARATRSDAAARLARAVLNAALETAVAWRLIERNPLRLAPRRRSRRGEAPVTPAQVWDREQAARFLAHVRGDPEEALWRLLLLGGLRLGEALALRWDAVDWRRGEVAVRRTLTRGADGRGAEREGTKGGRGRARAVALDAETLAALRRLRADQLAEGAASERVFPGVGDRPRDPSGVYRRFKRLTRAAGLPSIRVHDLRHSCATLLLAAGVNVKVVADRLGHHDPALTLRIYAHFLPGASAEAAAALTGFLAGEDPENGAVAPKMPLIAPALSEKADSGGHS